MFCLNENNIYHLYTQGIDMRKGIEGLCGLSSGMTSTCSARTELRQFAYNTCGITPSLLAGAKRT